MKRDRILIRGTEKNPIEIRGQVFQDAILRGKWVTFWDCKFVNCKRRFGVNSGFIRCYNG